MANLTDVSVEEMQAEIERRKAETKTKSKPKPLPDPDFSQIVKLCQGYVDALADVGWPDEGYDHWMFETAMNAVFGPKIWEWTNPILRGEME